MSYLKIKKADLVPDKFGKHIKITMIGEYDNNGKWVKLDKEMLNVLLQSIL